METTEPRALATALASPTFVTKTSGLAQHVANRHVERWAPEAGANQVRPLRNLGFVDRLVAPWIEAAQRSTSMRMFSQYVSAPTPEREPNNVSWVFPRPWYQDELDWMAAARQVGTQAMVQPEVGASMLTTRGTYVPPAQAVMPAALYEFVAPSLSVARPDQAALAGEAYSPLVPHAASQAATMMARVMAPLAPTRALSPGLRAVLTTMLERSARTAAASDAAPTRLSMSAPELVTPPAPRSDAPGSSGLAGADDALAIADSFAEQHARIAELQRAARIASERELVARAATATPPTAARTTSALSASTPSTTASVEPSRAAAITTRADASGSDADEQARIDARIAQRLAERVEQAQAQAQAQDARRTEVVQRHVETQRLHESAREAAARDARMATVRDDIGDAPREAVASRAVPAEVAAALAALPPELASLVAGGISARPEHAARAISDLSEALRTVELMARTTASGGSFASARGPRLIMPAGLGGLVATIERTTAEPSVARGLSPAAARAALMAQPAMSAQAARAAGIAPESVGAVGPTRSGRLPALSFLTSGHGGVPAATTALGAAAAAEPAALHHVAWADRWLARFAGAKTESLAALSAATGATSETRFAALASAAPGAVFVAPTFGQSESVTAHDDARDAATFSPGAAAQGALAARTVSAGGTFDAVATNSDVSPSRAAEAPPVVRIADDAETPDELFAMISQAATRVRTAPAATTATAQPAATVPSESMRTFERETLADLVSHAVPAAPGAGLSAHLASSPFAPALRHVLPLAAAPAFDIRALFGGGLSATYLAGLLAPATREIDIASMGAPSWATWEPSALASAAGMTDGQGATSRDVAEFTATYVAPDELRAPDATEAGDSAPAAELAAPLTTLRSALLSWSVDAIDAGGNAPVETRISAPTMRQSQTSAYSMLDAMTLPTLGESAALRELGAIDLAGSTQHASSYAAPGALADRAHSWSVAQERSSADLSFDFVPPELVLAARVYGLGPAEAAQAARLAIAGAGQLSAMAGAVDRTFVQALAIEHERRTGRAITAYPVATGDEPAAQARAASAAASATTMSETAGSPSASTTAFGVERRAPRGAFLWPSASIAALGLNASAPDGEQSTSVAALELLAAQAVAELGTFAALSREKPHVADGFAEAQRGETGVSARSEAMARGELARDVTAVADERAVVETATALVGSSRRAKFEAMYIALGQSSTARNWSPAARAARALALAGRGDETVSARERAEIAWDVLPVVAIGGAGDEGEQGVGPLSTGQSAQRTAQRRAIAGELSQFVEQRPGLSTLSSRAGEALGSYVAPQVAVTGAPATASSRSSGGSASREYGGAVTRAPSAAPELVQTGPRHGGGDTELPAWFEKAAKKMFEMPTPMSDNISLSELTLVQAAPSAHIAASSRSAPSAMPAAAPSQSAGPAAAHVDIDQIANDVYRQILTIMDATRARNGDPYL